MYNIRMKQSYR